MGADAQCTPLSGGIPRSSRGPIHRFGSRWFICSSQKRCKGVATQRGVAYEHASWSWHHGDVRVWRVLEHGAEMFHVYACRVRVPSSTVTPRWSTGWVADKLFQLPNANLDERKGSWKGEMQKMSREVAIYAKQNDHRTPPCSSIKPHDMKCGTSSSRFSFSWRTNSYRWEMSPLKQIAMLLFFHTSVFVFPVKYRKPTVAVHGKITSSACHSALGTNDCKLIHVCMHILIHVQHSALCYYFM